LLLALYALVAISLVFAQRCLRPEQPINHIDLAAFALPGGEAPALCAGKSDSEGGSHDRGCKVCETCAVSQDSQAAKCDDHRPSPVAILAASMTIPGDARGPANVPDNVRSRAPPGAVSLVS
jgi:hypothetical protein